MEPISNVRFIDKIGYVYTCCGNIKYLKCGTTILYIYYIFIHISFTIFDLNTFQKKNRLKNKTSKTTTPNEPCSDENDVIYSHRTLQLLFKDEKCHNEPHLT